MTDLNGSRGEKVMAEAETLVEYLLNRSGFSYDTEVPEELFEKEKNGLHLTDRTTVTDIYPDAESYRDGKKRKSVHITDFRGVDRDEMKSDVIVAHLERFNPEHHPILHSFIDLPIWYYKNRIREKNKL